MQMALKRVDCQLKGSSRESVLIMKVIKKSLFFSIGMNVQLKWLGFLSVIGFC